MYCQQDSFLSLRFTICSGDFSSWLSSPGACSCTYLPYLPYVWEWLDALIWHRTGRALRPAPFFCHQHDPPQRGSKVLVPTYYYHSSALGMHAALFRAAWDYLDLTTITIAGSLLWEGEGAVKVGLCCLVWQCTAVQCADKGPGDPGSPRGHCSTNRHHRRLFQAEQPRPSFQADLPPITCLSCPICCANC